MKSFKNWIKDRKLTFVDALNMAEKLGLDIKKYDPDEIVAGINTEKEHSREKDINVVKSASDLLKIALAHLREDPKYYKKLKKMEKNQ